MKKRNPTYGLQMQKEAEENPLLTHASPTPKASLRQGKSIDPERNQVSRIDTGQRPTTSTVIECRRTWLQTHTRQTSQARDGNLLNKLCFKCKQHKAVCEFSKDSSRLDGLRTYCRACDGAISANWKRNNLEKSRAAVKSWQKNNPEKSRAANTRWRKNNPDKLKTKLCSRRGITVEAFDSMLAQQNKKCSICSILMAPPCIDHDHSTGKVRALLCGKCNTGIGQFNDRPEVLRRAAGYLEQFSVGLDKIPDVA